MIFFEKYTSNTYAGSANQYFFNMEEGEKRTGRVFYKITNSGKFNYSLLFSNIIDSTYASGDVSHDNLICDSWTIHSARIGKCKHIRSDRQLSELVMSEDEDADITVFDLADITFGGSASKAVMPGEFFSSDPISLSFCEGEYLCLEMTFSGGMIPYHEESMLPAFVKTSEGWEYCVKMPFAAMVGCDRPIKKRVAYLGDSITQGIGAPKNSYLHWNALLSEKLGKEYAFWNLGIGYGRASDAASDGAWLYKAKQNDLIFVCYGVNDILQGESEQDIKDNLARIVRILKGMGKEVILQTVPPFNYSGERIESWERINDFIKTVLSKEVDALFDNVPCLSESLMPHMAKFGGHPNVEGCAAWADALYSEIGNLF